MKEMPPQQLDTTTNAIIALTARVHEAANRKIENLLKTNGLGALATSHGDILAALLRRGEITMTELAKLVHREKNTTTILVAKLQRLEFVNIAKGKDDARQKKISLTARGLSLEGPLLAISRDLLSQAYRGFSEEEKSRLCALLTKMLLNLTGNASLQI